MKPNFALRLSFDGIRLLHRAASGWRVVGDVSLETDDLGAELSALRKTASDLSPQGVRSKLIIPDEQIKYLSVETGDMDMPARWAAAKQALDGATPYPVSELSIAICVDGPQTHVAAVTKDTLHEAEAFAVTHRFHPVSFVALPEAPTFTTEPFFGVTDHAATVLAPGDEVEEDDAPMVVLGDIPVPDGPVAAEALTAAVVVPETEAIPPAAGPPPTPPEPPAPDAPIPAILEPEPIEPSPELGQEEAFASSHRAPQAPPAFQPSEPPAVGGKPRHLGLILTALLLIVLLGVAAWASIYVDDGLARFFRTEPNATQRAAVDDGLPDDFIFDMPPPEEEALQDALLMDFDEDADAAPAPATLEPALSEVEAAILDAMRRQQAAQAAEAAARTAAEEEQARALAAAQARYAITRIWAMAPTPPRTGTATTLDDFYLTSIDPISSAQDAVALPSVGSFDTDTALTPRVSPPPPGTAFVFDDLGRVIPTAEGAVSPDGVTVYLGRPDVVPPPTPTRFEAPPAIDPALAILRDIRPRTRPQDLAERIERAVFGGVTLLELGQIRPKLRPKGAQPRVDPDAIPTAQAAVQSPRPLTRPEGFAERVAQARSTAAAARIAAAAPSIIAPRTVSPSIPSNASVARAATQTNALNLRRINLIGVYGQPASRNALVRLANGRFKTVKVGDQIDGGRISAISDTELRYQKGSRNIVLKMPRG